LPHRRLRVGTRAARLAHLVGLLLGLQFRQARQGLLQPLLALPGGALLGLGLAAVARGPVLVPLGAPALDLGLGLAQALVQGGAAAEGGGPGAGPGAQAVARPGTSAGPGRSPWARRRARRNLRRRAGGRSGPTGRPIKTYY